MYRYYVIVDRFQELDLSNQAYVFSDSRKEEQWKNAVRKSLPVKGRYRKVSITQQRIIYMYIPQACF